MSHYVVSDQTAKAGYSLNGQEEFAVTQGQRLRFSLDGFGAVDYHHVDRPGFSPWARTRRLLCEARDRAWPIVEGLRTRKRRNATKIGPSAKVPASSW